MSTSTVADFITATDFNDLPASVVTQAKVAIQDHLGVLLAAYDDQAVAAARKLALALGGRGDATLIGDGAKVPCNMAAMVGAIMTRTNDMDDGAYRLSGHLAHAGGVVVPSCLAMAEYQHVTGKELITATVIAYEAALRAGWIISLWKMFAPAGMAGTYGAAAGASKLLRLSMEETEHALGVAEAHCLWPSKAKRFATTAMTKEAAGWGAMTGITAALLAQAGFHGPETLFDLAEYSREPLATLGNEWEIMGLYFKPYSSCRATHAPLDGVFQLVRQHDIKTNDISRIEFGIGSAFAPLMANYRPVNIWQAQFSIPFVIGVALTAGEVNPYQITEDRLSDEALLQQVDKVSLVGDKTMDTLAMEKGLRAARTRIEMKDGTKFETIIEFPKGAPQNPLSKEELDAKFLKLATGAMNKEAAGILLEHLNNLENLDDSSTLISLIGHL